MDAQNRTGIWKSERVESQRPSLDGVAATRSEFGSAGALAVTTMRTISRYCSATLGVLGLGSRRTLGGCRASIGKCALVLTLASAFGSIASAAAQSGLPAPVIGPGPTQFFNGVGFAAPQGWSVAQQSGGIGIKGPDRPNAGPCLAIIFAPIAAEADLALEAETLVNRGIAPLFGGGKYQGDLGQEIKTDPTTRSDGISGMGWPFVELYGKLGRSFTFVHVLLAKIGSQVVPLVGISQSGDWQCMGERDAGNWLLLVHGLVLPGYASPTDSLRKLIVGSWQSVSSHVAISETYAANGHFARYAAHASYWETNNGEIIQETSGWPGDGTYEVHGDRLTKKGANDASGTTYFFSIVRRPDRNRPTSIGWALRLVQKSPEGNIPFVNALGKVGD